MSKKLKINIDKVPKTTSTRFVPLSIRANRAKFGFDTTQKLFKQFSVQKTSFYTIIGILQCKNRNCPAEIEGGSGIPLPPTDHFSATSLKILFARIDRGSDRVVGGLRV